MSRGAPKTASTEAPAAPGERSDAAAQLRLEECWVIIDDTLVARSGEILGDICSAATRTREEAQALAASAVARHAKALAHAYRSSARSAYDAAVQGLLGRRAIGAPSDGALALVEFGESDLASQVAQWSARLRGLVSTPLGRLAQRLQSLVPGVEITERDSPFRPALYLEALAEALQTVLRAPGEVSALLRHMPGALCPELLAAYEAIDHHLEVQGVPLTPLVRAAPAVRPAAPAPKDAAPPASPAAAPAEPAPTAAPPAPEAQAPAPAASEAQAPAPATEPAAQAQAPSAPPPPDPKAQPDQSGLQEYIRLQAALGINAAVLAEAARAPAERALAPAEALVRAMLQAQKQDAAFAANAPTGAAAGRARAVAMQSQERPSTREHSRVLIGLATSPLHKLTIQLVARLFTRIEADEIVPGPVKSMLAALRFPFLEVALADPSVLTDAGQPARRLINEVGESAVGWTPDGSGGPQYWQALRSAVQFIVLSPGGAAAAFAQAHEHFAAFLAKRPAASDEPVNKAREALRVAEERESRAAEVGVFLGELLEGAPLDDYLRRFLLNVWPRVLVVAAEREKRHPGGLKRLLDVVPDLVWTVQPAPRAADHQKLAQAIPAVVAELRAGLELIRWPDANVQELLAYLMPAHAAVLAYVESADEPPAAAGGFSASTVRIRLDGFDIEELVPPRRDRPFEVLEEAVRHDFKRRRTGISHRWVQNARELPDGAPGETQAEATVASWKEGDWFDLRVSGVRTRVRLVGISPAGTLVLFEPFQGDARYSLSHASLVSYARRGWIRPVDAVPLIARAFQKILADVRRTGEAASGETGDAA